MMALGGPVTDRYGDWTESGRKLRGTEEFRGLVRRSGLVEYSKESGFPATCRPIGDDDFECD